MNSEQERKTQARQSFIREYPNIDVLCSATRASVLMRLLDKKSQLYNAPSPLIGDIDEIYAVSTSSEEFIHRCVTYIYMLKENQLPNDTIIRIHASNFFIACRRNTVNQLLCFIAEYPSIKQYSRGFDYTHMASKFKEYCTTWDEDRNKLIERRIKESERLSRVSDADCGITALEEYLRTSCMEGVDIRQSPLYKMRPIYRSLIDRIVGTTDLSSPEATEAHYLINASEQRIRENRKHLPAWLLSREEIIEFSKQKKATEIF